MKREIEIDVVATKALLDSDEEVLLLDCREQSENDTCRIEGGKLIPMRETKKRLNEIEAFKDKRVVVY